MISKIVIFVSTLPPKKDGANSMWNKPSELERIKALRMAAHQAMEGHSLAQKWVQMDVRIWADQRDGDVDNFITGI